MTTSPTVRAHTTCQLESARARTILEILAVFVLLVIELWEVRRLAHGAATWHGLLRLGLGAAIIWLVVSSLLRSHQNLHTLGLRPQHWRQGLVSLGLITAAGLIAIVAASRALAVPLQTHLTWKWFGEYVLTVILQQLLLQAFLNDGLHRILPPRSAGFDRAAVCAALLFALLHAPNPVLVPCAAVAGAFWCWHFVKHRNLPALMLSHFLLGLVAMICLGKGPLLGLRVGYPALRRLLDP